MRSFENRRALVTLPALAAASARQLHTALRVAVQRFCSWPAAPTSWTNHALDSRWMQGAIIDVDGGQNKGQHQGGRSCQHGTFIFNELERGLRRVGDRSR